MVRLGLLVGVLLTAASLYEQHVVLIAAAMAVGYVGTGGAGERGSRWAVMAVAAGVGAIAWAALAGYLSAVGRLAAAAHVLFADNVPYGGSLAANLASALRPEHLVPECMRWLIPLGLLGLFAGLLGRSGPARARRQWWVWASWVAGGWLTIALPGRFFPHYYQLWLPPACVAGGVAAARLVGGRWGIATGVRALALATAILPLAARELLPYGWTPQEWATHKFPSDNFVEQAVLSGRLAAMLRGDERFWLLGNDDSVYFLTQRSPVTGLLFLDAINAPPNGAYRRRLIADLNRSDAPLVIIRLSSLATLPADSPIPAWVRSRYDRVDTDLGCPSYGFWVRRGDDDLRGRLRSPPLIHP